MNNGKFEYNKIDTIVFDLDGTLLNTLDDLTAAVNHALGAFGYAPFDLARVRRYVGNGVPKLIDRALYFAQTGREPDMEHGEFVDRSLARACLAVFTEYYDKHNADMTKPYDGIAEMLSEVTACGIKSAIVTNKYDGAAQTLKAEFFGSVNVVVGAREGIRPKPATDGVYKALEELRSDKTRAVYVGDGETDIATAKNCGMPVVAVAWGFRDREELAKLGPDFIIDHPRELVKTLRAAGYIE
ncbi:MAG: HAD-IA family hydrolase [Clostridiales bacterium]|nr:HAD-IA family hydrolase [Clostridiales bacterium]